MASGRILNEDHPYSKYSWEHGAFALVREEEKRRTCEDGREEPETTEREQEAERATAVQVREAHEAGRREGEAEGRANAMESVREELERIAQSAVALAELRPKLRKEAESDLVLLAIAIARRILHREVSTDPDALRGIVATALEKLEGHEISSVRVHPAHESWLREAVTKARSRLRIELTADDSLPPGSIVFQTNRTRLDVSVAAQLDEIERGLADRLRH